MQYRCETNTLGKYNKYSKYKRRCGHTHSWVQDGLAINPTKFELHFIFKNVNSPQLISHFWCHLYAQKDLKLHQNFSEFDFDDGNIQSVSKTTCLFSSQKLSWHSKIVIHLENSTPFPTSRKLSRMDNIAQLGLKTRLNLNIMDVQWKVLVKQRAIGIKSNSKLNSFSINTLTKCS